MENEIKLKSDKTSVQKVQFQNKYFSRKSRENGREESLKEIIENSPELSEYQKKLLNIKNLGKPSFKQIE